MVNQTNNSNQSNSGSSTHSIDKLLDYFIANDGTAYYQVKWKPTWERADALMQYSDLIDSFWGFVNNAHKGNLYNNVSMIKGPDPVLPVSQPPLYTQLPVSNIASSTPPKQKQRKNSSTVTTPQRQNSTPQKRTPVQTPTKPMQTPTKRLPNTPTTKLVQTPSKPAVVELIDSDDEDVTEVGVVHGATATTPHSFNNTFPGQPQQHFQNFQNNMWNMNAQPKIEPMDMIDQKPMLMPNQQHFSPNNFNQQQMIHPTASLQQHQFPPILSASPVQNASPSGRGRGGGRGGGRGRGSGIETGAKRKLTQSPSTHTNNTNLGNVKSENLDDMNLLPLDPNEDLLFSNNMGESLQDINDSFDESKVKWEDTFEIIEKKNFDGTSLETQYKCTICATVISNKSSCSRHYNIHSGQKSHKCPICEKAFHRIDYMQRHLKVHGQGGGKELEGLIKLAMEGAKK